jgi:hypothetical protein
MNTMTDVGPDSDTAHRCSGGHRIQRRAFLTGAVTAAVGASLGAGVGGVAHAAALTKEQRDKLTRTRSSR